MSQGPKPRSHTGPTRVRLMVKSSYFSTTWLTGQPGKSSNQHLSRTTAYRQIRVSWTCTKCPNQLITLQFSASSKDWILRPRYYASNFWVINKTPITFYRKYENNKVITYLLLMITARTVAASLSPLRCIFQLWPITRCYIEASAKHRQLLQVEQFQIWANINVTILMSVELSLQSFQR